MKQLHLKIHGRVQGVNFRWFVKEKADKFGLVGWVKNYPDGSVEVSVEGKEKKVQNFLVFCKTGPAFSKVEKVEEEWGEIDECKHKGFNIVF